MPVGRTIDDKGELFFPFVGNIQAAGKTIGQFREELSKKLSKYITDPQVEVTVSAFRSKKIFLAGQVKDPGIVAISDQPMRITDAIGLAGGLTPEADLYNAVLTRNKVTVSINLDRIYYGGETSANILLQAGDILSIPDRLVRKIFVLGEFGNAAGINQSRSYVMRRGRMSLTEVISDAGGLNPFSSAAGKVFVMRADQNGEPLIYQLNGNDASSLILAEQFTMRPRDVVFVPPTDITEFGRFIAQFFPLTSGVQAVTNTPF
jgi:polysaccharide export outer membrane protein